MAFANTLHFLLSGVAGRTSLSLWSIVVASLTFYLTTLYIRKRRENQVNMSPTSEVTLSDTCLRQTTLSASSMVVYRWKLY